MRICLSGDWLTKIGGAKKDPGPWLGPFPLTSLINIEAGKEDDCLQLICYRYQINGKPKVLSQSKPYEIYDSRSLKVEPRRFLHKQTSQGCTHCI